MKTSKESLLENAGNEYYSVKRGWKIKLVSSIPLFFILIAISMLSSCLVVSDQPHHYWHRGHNGGEHRDRGEHRGGEEHHDGGEHR
jgi:hypothetical protein